MELPSLLSMTTRSIFNNFTYHVLVFCLILLLSGFPVSIATSRLRENETDRLSLLSFKAQITHDPLQVLTSWNDSLHFCQWHGITCSRRRQRVTALDLQSQKLKGAISPHIGNVSFLRELLLHNNSFGHVIPSELGRLRRLQVLRLENNSIGGEIPANISACSNLVVFRVAYNMLGGKIPEELGSLSKLRAFRFGANYLTGSIPSSLGNLSSLEQFFVAKNSLGGGIPDSLCRLTNLKFVAIGGNKLSGEIPPSLFNHSSLLTVDVTMNQLEGSLPSELGNILPSIQYLGIAYNQLTGYIPVSISNATNLVFFIATGNKLTGKVPSLERLHQLQRLLIAHNSLGNGETNDLSFICSLTNATSLFKLDLNTNNFGGMLPKSVSNLSTILAEMFFSYNQIFGSIPAGILNLLNLETLYLTGNQLTGDIPPDIGKLRNLKMLGFEGNKLSGNIPSSVGNLTLLTEFSLSENNLHGSIPSTLGKCQSLIGLDLSKNNLSGTIPQELFDLSLLSIVLNLSHNHLTGSLPVEVGNLKNLGYLDVSGNELSEEIPDTLGSCIHLELLFLQGNFFRGTIPSSLRLLRGIQFLDLSCNNLSGEIPAYLETFGNLQLLDLSFNDLEGVVPREGIFTNASAISVTGNGRLCGGISELKLPVCNFRRSKKRSALSLKLGITISFGLLGEIVLLCFLYFCWFKKTRKEPSLGSLGNSLMQMSYQTLLKATNSFSSANLIGMGSFGSVYKGILEHNGSIVAVKVLNLVHRGASKSFLAECEALRNFRHRNLLKVITACSSVDYQGNDFKALVYEFMAKGSLEEWLHPIPGGDVEQKVAKKLTFLRRLNIAIDVACALEYLHHQCQTPIVHCDLKPSNVLLSDDMTAHVGDFGLARFLSAIGQESYPNDQASSVGLRGSIGYAAPEYGIGGQVSTNGDVYSFGILLLEMLTGKRPTDDMFRENLNLHNFVKAALPDKVEEIVDSLLLQGIEEEHSSTFNRQSSMTSHTFQGCLASLCRIGVVCSKELARERMSIGEALAELHQVRHLLLGAGMHKEPC